DYEQFCGVPILDPKSIEETAAEVKNARGGNGQTQAAAKRDPNLDARGLPPNYPFKPDWEVTPREVKQMLDRGEQFFFVDCRLPNEYQITHIEGAKLIPLQQIGQHADELRKHQDEKIVVHCKSGGRSMQFTQ